MLHILWMILKFILIVLGILLGLFVLSIILILFCPLGYRAQVSGNLEEWKKAQGTVSVSWLFRGIVLTLRLEDGKTAHSIRILGIPVEKLKRRRKPSGLAGKASSKRKRSSPEKKKIQSEEPSGQQKKVQPVKPSDFQEEVQNREKIYDVSGSKSGENGVFKKIRNIISGMMDKLKKIPAVIRDFINGIQNVYDKIEYGKQFLEDPRVKEALSFAWQRSRRLVKHILPVRMEGDVTFGCEDPSVTGTALAILGITIPFHKNCIEVHPLFDGQNYLEGEVKLRGRVYGIILAVTAVQIYFNKNIKYVISRWKHKEESL